MVQQDFGFAVLSGQVFAGFEQISSMIKGIWLTVVIVLAIGTFIVYYGQRLICVLARPPQLGVPLLQPVAIPPPAVANPANPE